jgi:methionyl-tRNA formyltransferase
MNKSLKLIFAGTPEFSVPALYALHAAGHEIVAVLTQPDRPAGRGQKLKASPVKVAALDLGLDILQPSSLRKAKIKKHIRSLQADAMIVAAYGLILPQSVLDMPHLGCINIHASILPRWRGAAPIQRALEAGDKMSGITIMQMDAGLDTGDMLSRHPIEVGQHDTSQVLHDKLAKLGAEAIVKSLTLLAAGDIKAEEQNDSEATYANKLHKSEAQIIWSESAEVIERKIRAFNPWPCAFTYYENNPLRVWKSNILDLESKPSAINPIGSVIHSAAEGIDVQTGCGILRMHEVQEAGRKRLTVDQFVNAHDLSGYQFEHTA